MEKKRDSSKVGDLESFSSMSFPKGKHTHPREGAPSRGPDVFTDLNQPLLELPPGDLSKDTRNRSSEVPERLGVGEVGS